MIVPKNPRPSYFCGCPPCPLCFDIVSPAGTMKAWQRRLKERVAAINFWRQSEEVVADDVEVIPMIVDMAEKTLGREPDEKELLELIGACEAIHVYNKSSKERRDAELAAAQEAALIKRAEDVEREKNKELLAGCVATRDKPEPAKVNTVLVDTMDRKKVEALCVTDDEVAAKKAMVVESTVSEADRRALQRQEARSRVETGRGKVRMGPTGSLKDTAGMGKAEWMKYDYMRMEQQMLREMDQMKEAARRNLYPSVEPPVILTEREAKEAGMSYREFIEMKQRDPSRFR